jgi:hypothetical protein
MKTTKEILTENRDSIISSIKFMFKVYSNEQIKDKMIQFMNFCQVNEDKVLKAYNAKNTKTQLKNLLCRMNYEMNRESINDEYDRLSKISVASVKDSYAESIGGYVNTRTGTINIL